MKHLLLLVMLVSTHFALMAQPLPPPSLDIQEIMYNPPESGADSLEFIVVYWFQYVTSVDLSGCYFSSGIDFTFPNGFILEPGPVIISKDSVAMMNTFGIEAFQWNNSSLLNTGESIVLRTPNGYVLDSVHYGVTNPWPEEANGNGNSLIKCYPGLSGNDANNWIVSTSSTGVTVNGHLIFADFGSWTSCTTVGLDGHEDSQPISIYPNPATTNLTIESRTPLAQVWVRDVAGRAIINETLRSAQSDKRTIDVSSLPSGIYLVEVLTQNGQRSVQKVVVE